MSKLTESYAEVSREKVDRLRTDFDHHEGKQSEEQIRIWEAINDLRSRLPNWAVLTIATLTAVCGWLVGQLKG